MIRTCISCNEKKEKIDLIRFAGLDNCLAVDYHYKMDGRGVYCCRKKGCIHALMRKEKQLSKALRCNNLKFYPDKESFITEVMTSIVAKLS